MTTVKSFQQLGLPSEILAALVELGYEVPTPIQAQSIPVLLTDDDLLAQAQTGTGKTAAFALPILAKLDTKQKKPQALVLAPTRELAIQVAEAFQRYAGHLKNFFVTPIYGGQDYATQLRALKRGSQVIVGTPGRVMDHLRRGTLSLKAIKTLVLDEADEMLNMGFIDDIEWILEHIPESRQTGLFSATMPNAIQKISQKYLHNPEKIQIKAKTRTVESVEQYYMRVNKNQKLEALTRFLDVEQMQAAIIFARTKNCTEELAGKLQARGYTASALNGDMNQGLRKKVIAKLKSGELDIAVATDVAARGIDIERISHVINFDIPTDNESYIHRVGRTGRAGRTGKALSLIIPREQRLLSDIERTIGMKIKLAEPPSVAEMNKLRSKQLADKINNILTKSKQLAPYREMVADIIETHDCPALEVATALAYLTQQANPLAHTEINMVEPEREQSNRKRSNRKSDHRNWRQSSPSKRRTFTKSNSATARKRKK